MRSEVHMLIGGGYAISVVSTLAVVPVYTADRSQEATALGFMCAGLARGQCCRLNTERLGPAIGVHFRVAWVSWAA